MTQMPPMEENAILIISVVFCCTRCTSVRVV